MIHEQYSEIKLMSCDITGLPVFGASMWWDLV